MRLYTGLLYFYKQLYMFRVILSPIIRSTRKLYLQHLALDEPCLLPSSDVEESDSSTTADGRKYGLTNARCCNYSLYVLLMMGEVSSLQEIINCI